MCGSPFILKPTCIRRHAITNKEPYRSSLVLSTLIPHLLLCPVQGVGIDCLILTVYSHMKLPNHSGQL